MKNLSKNYNPKDFEARIYNEWKDNGYFIAHADSGKKPFTIVMPPPNVTGKLHLGHAMNNTIQDILIRQKRMQGFEALWVPGTDHASISTEAKVVERIRKNGESKESLGREGFLEQAWLWTKEYGGSIKEQLMQLGVSCDWTRDSFTLDQNLSEAVQEVFIRMYQDHLIYQGDRIVNWCPSCHTAVSDIEVEHKEENGKFWHIRYPFKNREGYVVIATTRPETMLGDLAVAVHPLDERYADIIGEKLILPLVNREIPIIADEYVDREFGTGMVKITPSHDPNDFEVGERHHLGQCKVINEEAKIVEGYSHYSGLDRYEARKLLVEDLEREGLLENVEDHTHMVGHCERCQTTIEPLISKQWFVKMESLAKPALKVYQDKQLHLIPDRFGKIYTNWLENIKDWCISRQLWWGHRLPVYYNKITGETVVARENPNSEEYIQDEDTLDTWFSSALWPFSTLGWPHQTEDLKTFFPTDVLVTGYDIIFFWVIRMVFSSLYNMNEIPFHHVYFTGLIRDAQGRKMSKSLNNGIDPLEVIDQYGADALRFTLITGTSPGNDMRFYMEKVEANRNFANKLWNATRFVFMNLNNEVKSIEDCKLEIEDRWIISRLNTTVKEVTENIEKYEFGLAAEKIYSFIWNELCDWYIELVKPRLYNNEVETNEAAQATLVYVLMDAIKLLHPFMPFITEEIYSYMPTKNDMLINDKWPIYQENLYDETDEKKINFLIDAITSIRNRRQESNIAPNKKATLLFEVEDPTIKEYIEDLKDKFYTLTACDKIEIHNKVDEKDALSIVKTGYRIFIPLEGLIDYQKELEKLQSELKNATNELKRANSKLENQSFTKKAPQKLVDLEVEKQAKYTRLIKELEETIKTVRTKINE